MLFITSNLKTYIVCLFLIFSFWTIYLITQIIGNESQLHFDRGHHDIGDILEDCGISDDKSSTIHFSLSTCHDEPQDNIALFSNDVDPSVKQTTKGQSVFLSSLYSVVRHIKEYAILID